MTNIATVIHKRQDIKKKPPIFCCIGGYYIIDKYSRRYSSTTNVKVILSVLWRCGELNPGVCLVDDKRIPALPSLIRSHLVMVRAKFKSSVLTRQLLPTLVPHSDQQMFDISSTVSAFSGETDNLN